MCRVVSVSTHATDERRWLPGSSVRYFCRQQYKTNKGHLPDNLRALSVLLTASHIQGVLISPYHELEGNKLQRQKILRFIYPIYIVIIIGEILVLFIQGVPGGMDKTSGECSLC